MRGSTSASCSPLLSPLSLAYSDISEKSDDGDEDEDDGAADRDDRLGIGLNVATLNAGILRLNREGRPSAATATGGESFEWCVATGRYSSDKLHACRASSNERIALRRSMTCVPS